MPVKVYIDGAIHGPEDASISVFDRGFLYGDSVYEVMRTAGGHPVDLAAHLQRLARSAAILDLATPPLPAIEDALGQTLAAAGNPESYIRVVVTRGCGEIGLDIALADTPSLIVLVKPLKLLPAVAYQNGIALRVVGVQRTPKRVVHPAVKSGNYLNNIMALREARAAGADEAIMCDGEGRVAEGASSNLFVVHGGTVTTPGVDVDLLPGITRARVLGLARADAIAVVEGTLTPEQVLAADEVFITSSIRGVVPVRRVDEHTLAPVPGPVSRRILELYAGFLDRVARGPGNG